MLWLRCRHCHEHQRRTGSCWWHGEWPKARWKGYLLAQPANFLDGGGGATEANVRAAMGVILSDPDAKVLFINSFGGITRMDLLARGMVECITRWKQEGHKVPPVIARLRGTGEDEARQIVGSVVAQMSNLAARGGRHSRDQVLCRPQAGRRGSRPPRWRQGPWAHQGCPRAHGVGDASDLFAARTVREDAAQPRREGERPRHGRGHGQDRE